MLWPTPNLQFYINMLDSAHQYHQNDKGGYIFRKNNGHPSSPEGE